MKQRGKEMDKWYSNAVWQMDEKHGRKMRAAISALHNHQDPELCHTNNKQVRYCFEDPVKPENQSYV
jgi:hypothetical protein